MFANTSNYAHNVDFVMTLIVGISVFLLLGITFTMIYFMIRYNHKKNPKASQIRNNNLLEVIWIVVPVLFGLDHVLLWICCISGRTKYTKRFNGNTSRSPNVEMEIHLSKR